MSKASQLVKMILFVYFFLQLSNLSYCSDSSLNPDESNISEKQNTLYDDLDDEESQSLQRSKRDDLNKESDYTYEDEGVDEKASPPKISTNSANQNSPNDASMKNSPECDVQADSQTSLNQKSAITSEKKDAHVQTKSDETSQFDEKLNATLELVKKQLEDSFNQKLFALRDELRKVTEWGSKFEKSLDGSSVDSEKLLSENSEGKKNDEKVEIEKRHTKLEKKRDKVQRKRESKHQKKRRKHGKKRREARDKKLAPANHEALKKVQGSHDVLKKQSRD